jgi:hypothetical protein
VTSAEDNSKWVRDRIAENGWTADTENEAIRRVRAYMEGSLNIAKGERMVVPHGPDGPAHPNDTCVCCKGTATKLRWDAETEQKVCVDRELCRLTMQYDHMLANVRSS